MSGDREERLPVTRRVVRLLIAYGKALNFAIELIIIASITVLTVLTAYDIVRRIMTSYTTSSTEELRIIINCIFILIVYAELIRSILVAYRRPEMYLVGIAEVGFVIAIRETLESVISESPTNLLISSLASLALALVLWILYRQVLPHRMKHA